ncbi:MAG: hypothetical protein LBJ89_04155 [Holosporales bacterium]|nr:hypothetical protein [Holosporales bacterium]
MSKNLLLFLMGSLALSGSFVELSGMQDVYNLSGLPPDQVYSFNGQLAYGGSTKLPGGSTESPYDDPQPEDYPPAYPRIFEPAQNNDQLAVNYQQQAPHDIHACWKTGTGGFLVGCGSGCGFAVVTWLLCNSVL